MKASILPLEDIMAMEVGWYYRVIAIDRSRGIFTFEVGRTRYEKQSLLDKIRRRRPRKVIEVNL